MAKTKPTTHVLMIVDMSGSMGFMPGLATEVRNGFNEYLDNLKGGRYRITTTVFDTEFIPLSVATRPKDTPRLNDINYMPRGMTALCDAVGLTITGFEEKHTLAEGERVLVVVQTDGQENSSQRYTYDRIAAMVKEREETGRWEFLYLGAGLGAWGEGQRMGFTNNYSSAATPAGTSSRYAGTRAATRSMAAGGQSVDIAAAVASTEGLVDESTGEPTS